MKKRTVLEKQIKQIAKKMNIFTAEDVEILTEKPRVEIAMRLEKMVVEGKLKQDRDCFIHIQKNPPAKKAKEIEPVFSETLPDDYIRALPFQPKKPKEVYFRRINQIDGYQDYFFASKKQKEKIKWIFKVLKTAHGLKGKSLLEVLKEHKMSIERYRKYKKEILTNGVGNLVTTRGKGEPREIYYFFKEYYLSPKRYDRDEAWQLAINKFAQITGINMLYRKITRPKTMYHWLLEEYSSEEIQKLRTANFSEFDMESFLKR